MSGVSNGEAEGTSDVAVAFGAGAWEMAGGVDARAI